ncbi:MAG: PEGA domain-containing protein [Acidobacteria bacterium]|nr:PEGA domain-containing protein [Acidobacteriota bacterium]
MIRFKFCTTFSLCLAALLVGPASLSSAERDGYLKAAGKPTGAGVFVDGKYLGPASRFTVAEKYPLSPGDHQVSLQDPRFQDFSAKVTIIAGKTTTLEYRMERAEVTKPPYGRLRFGGGVSESFISVTSGDTSAVYLNNKFYGYVDELNNAGGGLLLPPGVYDLRVSSPVYGEINQKVTIEANQVTLIPLKSVTGTSEP